MANSPAFAAALAAVLLAAPAQAAIIGTCTIVIGPSGTMVPNPAITALSSKLAGGSAARATVTMNSLVCIVLGLIDCYSVSAPPPASFAASPGGGGTGVAFTSTYRIDGGGEIAGSTATKRRNGTYDVTVDLVATRAAGVFPAGDYRAEVTLRCE